jgi:CBS domain containing-hemolysin-like protein
VAFVGQNRKKSYNLRWIVTITFWTFILAIVISIVAQLLFVEVESFIIAVLILLVIIFTGIIFDMIGIAATAADEVPLLAKAAKKVPGAREALYLLRNADRFANFCNDVVGDIAGIISGVLGAFLVLRLVTSGFVQENPFFSIVATGLISAITVGGKAYGKSLAIDYSTDIILTFAYILTRVEAVLPGRLFFGNDLPPRRK